MTTSTRATRAGTTRFAGRFAARFTEEYFRSLAGLAVGSIGVGTFLGPCTDDEDARYERATRLALEAGCNVIDTAINYRCQRSERAVGHALARAIGDGVVQRDEVVVCTKGGFVALDGEPPATRDAYDAYLARELFDAGIVSPDEIAAGGHSLAPRFLAHQIARSRVNLGVETIDLYYLHEPERQLDAFDAVTFRVLLRHAVEALEGAVRDGHIARWGVASWRGVRVPPTTKGHLALAEIVAAARDVAGDAHHFAAVQVPVNLAMLEAVRVPTQAIGGASLVSVLQAAQTLGIDVVASASLMQAQLAANLPAQLRDALPGCESDAQRAVTFVRALPGVRVALIGMREPAHLAENLRSAR